MGPVSESTTAAAGDTDSPLGRFVWLNGSIVPTAEAKVSVLDRGLLRGEGVFETMRTYGGALFAAGRHLARMQMSADAAGVRLPPPEVLREAVSAAVAANGFPESRVQLTVTSGPGGPTPDPIGHPEPTLVVIVLPLGSQTARPVVTAVTLPWIRHESAALTGVKPTSYLDHLVGHKWAHQQGADEGLWRNSAGEVTEATGSNLFVVRGGVVLTPPLSAGLLPGVTRDLVLERCRARKVPAEETTLAVPDVAAADECFLTSTTKEAVAVASLDGHPVGTGHRPVLDALVADWHEWAPRHLEP